MCSKSNTPSDRKLCGCCDDKCMKNAKRARKLENVTEEEDMNPQSGNNEIQTSSWSFPPVNQATKMARRLQHIIEEEDMDPQSGHNEIETSSWSSPPVNQPTKKARTLEFIAEAEEVDPEMETIYNTWRNNNENEYSTPSSPVIQLYSSDEEIGNVGHDSDDNDSGCCEGGHRVNRDRHWVKKDSDEYMVEIQQNAGRISRLNMNSSPEEPKSFEDAHVELEASYEGGSSGEERVIREDEKETSGLEKKTSGNRDKEFISMNFHYRVNLDETPMPGKDRVVRNEGNEPEILYAKRKIGIPRYQKEKEGDRLKKVERITAPQERTESSYPEVLDPTGATTSRNQPQNTRKRSRGSSRDEDDDHIPLKKF